MTAHAIDEQNRVSTQLELLFDLSVVVAVAAISHELAQGISTRHAGPAILPFLEVFFAIWWAWMNFTWFASSYGTDDVPYRLLTMLQMAGVLTLAAGVPAAFERGDFRVVTIGYLIMRIGLLAQWIRAAREDPQGRATAIRYASGIALLEVLWMGRLVVTEATPIPDLAAGLVFLVLVVLEASVPIWAEKSGSTSWHPHHIAERYGLFTIILLGEGVLAASMGLGQALEQNGVSIPLVATSAACLVILFSLWWLYFLSPSGSGLTRHRSRSWIWGYGHYGLLASLAAVGAGLTVNVERGIEGERVSATVAAYAIAIPVALALVLPWLVSLSVGSTSRRTGIFTLPAALIIVIVPSVLPQAALVVSAVTVAALVAVSLPRPTESDASS